VTCDRSVVFSTNKTDCHDIAEVLLKVALDTINQTKPKPIIGFPKAINKNCIDLLPLKNTAKMNDNINIINWLFFRL
jgi:hypothetical protein